MVSRLFAPTWPVRLWSWLVLAFLTIPTLIVVPLSFGDPVQLIFPPVTWSTIVYEKLFSDAAWIQSTLLSFKIAAMATAAVLLIGIPAVYGLFRTNLPGRQLIYGLFMMPAVIPVVVLGLGLYLYFVKLGLIGTEFGIVAAHVAVAFPFVTTTLIAGMKEIDPNLEKAAYVMGAGKLYTFTRVVLPLLSRSIIAAGLFAFLLSFDETIITYFIGDSRNMTLPVRMYQSVRWDSTPILAAVSSLLTVMSFAICLVASLILKRNLKLG